MPQKVGVIGSAVVGQTLAKGFKKHGYEVRIGSRTPEKLADFTASTGIAAGTFADPACASIIGTASSPSSWGVREMTRPSCGVAGP